MQVLAKAKRLSAGKLNFETSKKMSAKVKYKIGKVNWNKEQNDQDDAPHV